MLSRVKKSHSTSRLVNSQGQALVEYVLMLVITVSLVLMLVYQIFTPLQGYLSNYMGKYIQCLLEMGELPSLGAADSPVKDEGGDCNSRFDAATLGSGRPPTGASSSGEKSSRSSSASSSSSSTSGGSYAGSASRGGRSFLNSRNGASQGMKDSGASGKVVEINLDQGGGGSFFRSSSNSAGRRPARKTTYVAISGLTEAEQKKLQKKAEGGGNTRVVGEGFAPAPKKTTVKPRAPQAVIPEDEPMTIGNFIRILFIAAIIIALVVLIGGQALQMSKNFEK